MSKYYKIAIIHLLIIADQFSQALLIALIFNIELIGLIFDMLSRFNRKYSIIPIINITQPSTDMHQVNSNPHQSHSPSFRSNKSLTGNTHHFPDNINLFKNCEYFESTLDQKERSHTPSTDEEIEKHQNQSLLSRINIYGTQMEVNFMKFSSMLNFVESIEQRTDLQLQTRIGVQLIVLQKAREVNPNLKDLFMSSRIRYQQMQMEKIFN